jgi:hypothetical protein
MDNILCDNILRDLNKNKLDMKKKDIFIADIIEKYISCENTFMDSYYFYYKNIRT